MKHVMWVSALAILLVGCGKPEVGPMGPAGPRGEAGPAGPSGPAGQDGANGLDATLNAYSIVEIVSPCGGTGTSEVLLRLANGQVLASFSEQANGKNTRFVILAPGTYQTTDGRGCVFTVNADGSII